MKKYLSLLVIFLAINSAAVAADAPDTITPSSTNNTIIAKEYLAGVFAARNNDFETASTHFEEALTKTPNDQILLQNAYSFTLLAGKYDKAADYAMRYLEYNPHSINALMFLAIKAVKDSEYQKASAILEGAPRNNKTNLLDGVDQLILPFIRMWINAGEGNYSTALNILHHKSSANIVSNIFLTLQKASLLSVSGNVEEATKIFDILIEEPEVMPYNLAKSAATFYESVGKWDEAKRVYIKYRAQHPALPHFEDAETKIANKVTSGLYIKTPNEGLAEILKETARLLFSNQLYNEGLVYLRLALLLRPTDDETIMLLASYNEERKNTKEAIKIYNDIGIDSDFHIISQVNKAEDLYKLGSKKEAKTILLGLAEKIKAKYIPLVTLADLLRRDNQFKDAIKIYTRVLENIDKKNTASWAVFFARAICYERSGNWQKAESDMIDALELNPNQPEVTNYLAYSWIEHNKNLRKARDMLLKAVARRPNDPQILDSTGWALYKLDDYDNSIIFLEKAGEIIPQDAVINDHLGDLYWMLGRRYEAKYQWQRAIKYGPAESSTEAELQHKIEKGLEE